MATTPEDLLPTVYLCTNQVAPSHEGIELGIGDATLVKVCHFTAASSVHANSETPVPFTCVHMNSKTARHLYPSHVNFRHVWRRLVGFDMC